MKTQTTLLVHSSTKSRYSNLISCIWSTNFVQVCCSRLYRIHTQGGVQNARLPQLPLKSTGVKLFCPPAFRQMRRICVISILTNDNFTCFTYYASLKIVSLFRRIILTNILKIWFKRKCSIVDSISARTLKLWSWILERSYQSLAKPFNFEVPLDPWAL